MWLKVRAHKGLHEMRGHRSTWRPLNSTLSGLGMSAPSICSVLQGSSRVSAAPGLDRDYSMSLNQSILLPLTSKRAGIFVHLG